MMGKMMEMASLTEDVKLRSHGKQKTIRSFREYLSIDSCRSAEPGGGGWQYPPCLITGMQQ